MGSCVSVHKSSVSVMKFSLTSFGSKNDKLAIPPSPVKEKPTAGSEIRIKDIALTAWTPSPSANTFSGSKEEAFFDSKAWLDSDCEDDFYSVNGDFTPSRGSTPTNLGIARANKSPFEARLPSNDIVSTPSPTEKKKRLLDLFKESVRDDEAAATKRTSGATATTNGTPEVKSRRGTPFLSGANSLCSSERTPSGELGNYTDDKPMRSMQCCLPSLVSCRSFTERKKKMSPAIAANDRA